MNIKHKYVEPVLIFLTVYIFNVVLFKCGELLFIYAYNYLTETLPHLVKTVSPIHSPDEYELYLKASVSVAAFIGLWLINYVSLRLDNKKFEYVITKTDGQYRMTEGLSLYFREFLASDAIASTLMISAFVIPAAFIPEKLMDRGLVYIFKLGEMLIGYYGIVGAVIIAVIFSLATRLISVPLCLRTWRALWLSGSV